MLRLTRKLCLIASMTTIGLFAADPSVGTWKLNTETSIFSPGPAPKSGILTVSQDGDWFIHKTTVIDAEGQTRNSTNRYRRDGKEYPWRGPNGEEGTLAVHKNDDRHFEWVFKTHGGAAVKGRTVLAEDGKTVTQTASGTNDKGQKVDSTVVYDRK